MNIPLFSESGEFLRMHSDEEIRILLYNREATLVRDRKGRHRRAILIARIDRPLMGAALHSAIASYSGAVKYTYLERFESAPPCHALKRYNSKTRMFEKWGDT